MIEKTYIVIPLSELTQNMINECIQTSMETLRKNNTATKVILKYEGSKPTSVINYETYSLPEILIETQKPEWQPEIKKG